MRQLLRDYIMAVSTYTLLIAAGLVLTLITSSIVGYLPYSDRPGPGWFGPSFSFDTVLFVASWSVLLVLPAVIYGTALFAYNRLLAFLSAPSWLIRTVAAVTAAASSFLLAAGIGWYISMASFPVWIAAGLGAIWGAALLPRYLGSSRLALKPAVKAGAIGLVLLAVPLVAYSTVAVFGEGQHLEISVVRITEGVDTRSSESHPAHVRPSELARLDSLYPNSRFDQVVSGVSVTGAGVDTARMLIVLTDTLRREARLRVPRNTSVIYVQRGDRWDILPHDARTLRERVKLGVTSDPNELTFAWPGGPQSTYKLKPK